MNIAVLGLGRMGQALAHRLIDGDHDLTVWNRSKGRAGDLVEMGASEADSPDGAVSAAEVVIVSLANDDAVRGLTVRSRAVRNAIGSRPYLETSTISPSLSAHLGRTYHGFVALPILGAPQAVRQGQATYLAGGQATLIGRLDPVWDSLGGTLKRYPGPELASAGKLAVNLLLLSGVVTLAEALTVGRAGGLNDEQLTDLLGNSPMLAPGLKNRFQGVIDGSGGGWWTNVLAAKDARLAIETAASAYRDLPVAAAVHDRYQAAVEAWMDDEDVVAVARLYHPKPGEADA
jgi:3-hydroxyisobutyrate dehydrogenase-like beta-hydroxyacid dehydrogenase